MKNGKYTIQFDGTTDVKFSLSETRVPVAVDFGASFIISGVLAMVFRSMIAPLERIKLILQTQASSHQIGGAEQRSSYTGVLNALVRIPREQGILSMWRGNFLNVSRYFPAQAINFSFYDLYYNAFEQVIEPNTARSQIILPFLAGGAVGVTSCTILYPLNFCTTRIAVDVGDSKLIQREFFGLNDCVRKVYKTDGCKGFYQGLLYASSAVFVFRSIYFGLYTFGKRTYLNHFSPESYKVNAPVLVCLAIAQSSSMFATFVAYPLDTISRQKMLCSGRGTTKYSPMCKVVNNIIEKDGPIGFYRGISANFMTAICGSLLLVTYDIVKSHFDRLIESKRTEP